MCTGVMIAAAVAQGGMAMSQGQSNAKSIRSQGRINSMMSEYKREQLEETKADILEQGDEEANERQKQLRQMLGSQKVAFAAQGIEVEGDLGATLEEDARRTTADDVKAIKNNAWKQAMGIEMDQEDLKLQDTFNKVQTEARAGDAFSKGVAGAVGSAANAYGIYSKSKSSSGGKTIPKSSNKYTVNYKKSSFNSRTA